MSFLASRYDDLQDAAQTACDRFVPPSVAAGEARGEARRLIGGMLFAPALMSVAMAAVFPSQYDLGSTLAAVAAVFAMSWAGVLAAAGTRTSGRLQPFALVGLTIALTALIFATGGLTSPAALLLVALPIEAHWVRRTRTALAMGFGAALAALAALFAAGFAWPAALGAANAWHWLLPLGYAATLLPRFGASRREDDAEQDGDLNLLQRLDGVVLRLARGGDVLDAGDKAHDVLKLAPELLRGTGLFDRLHVADRVTYMCALGELRDGGSPARIVVRVRLPKPADQDAATFRTCSIEFCGATRAGEFVALLRDHSEITDLQAALRDARDKTEDLDLAKGRFLAAVSHELRTPLNAIIGFSDILLHEIFGGFTDGRQREYTQLIKESGHHLLDVVNAILDVSKIESGTYSIQTENFAFADAAEMCRSMMALQASKKNIDLRTQISPALGEVAADRRAVQQILINLVSNAIKFTPEHGSVVLGAQRLGSRLHFWVADTGIGIAAEDLDRIGRPFTQIRNDYTRQYEGTGLGLSLVKGLVGLHQGTMSIESAPAEGTKVSISLPVDGPQGSGENAPRSVAPAFEHEVSHGTFRKTA